MSDPSVSDAPVADPGARKGGVSVVEPTRAEQVLARRVAESKATIPHVTARAEADVEDALALVAGDVTVGDLLVRAAALALRDVPRANASYRDARFEVYAKVNVGFVVDGVAAPTIFDADTTPLADVARAARALEGKVRDGSIRSPELGGATFTVAHHDVPGVREVAGIVLPPQAGMLTAGAIEPRAVVRGGQVAARAMLALTLVADARILPAGEAARFLGRVVERLAQPDALRG